MRVYTLYHTGLICYSFNNTARSRYIFVLLFPANRMYNQTMSLTSDDLADIKQLMTSLLDAQERRLDKRFDEQDERLDEILNAVGGELNEQDKTVSDHTEQIQNHEKRILRLEKRIA